jgi:hypothetical protein
VPTAAFNGIDRHEQRGDRGHAFFAQDRAALPEILDFLAAP